MAAVRWFTARGDAMLAEFGSAAAAVQAAIEIQERMARFNETIDEDQRLMFRIGVHLGEIIIDEAGHDIFGDGVNLAERIQVLAEPGGIAVSRAVRDVARLRDDYAYVDGGEHRAKHVSLPLHIYRVRAREHAATVPTRPVPVRGIFHFHGADDTGRKFGFDLEMDELAKRKQSVLIGRDSSQCDVVLLNTSVSRCHARLSVGTGQHPADRGHRIDQRHLDRRRAASRPGCHIPWRQGRRSGWGISNSSSVTTRRDRRDCGIAVTNGPKATPAARAVITTGYRRTGIVRLSLSKGVIDGRQLHKGPAVATAMHPRVTVHIPVEVTYDLGKSRNVIESLGGRLGCGPCISGAACTFELITDYLVDPATSVKPILMDRGEYRLSMA